jgi:hypothetical protein
MMRAGEKNVAAAEAPAMYRSLRLLECYQA